MLGGQWRRTGYAVACWGFDGSGQATPPGLPEVPTTRVLPTATFVAPTAVPLGQSFPLALTGAQVPGGYTSTFTYQFDCGDGQGYAAPTPASSASCPAGTAGPRTVRGRVIDQDGDARTYTATVVVGYAWTGFFAPVSNPPAVNVMTAGRAVPLKFALGGDRGLAILAAGSPSSQRVACTSGAPSGTAERALTPGNSGLTYDAGTGQYTYVWKTERAWAGSCRRLTLTLADGSAHTALFSFR